MIDQHYLVREPLVEPSGVVSAYELSLQKDGRAVSQQDIGAGRDLIGLIGDYFLSSDAAQFGDAKFFLSLPLQALLQSDLTELPAQRMVFRLHRDDFIADEAVSAIQSLHQQGFGICLGDPDLLLNDGRIGGLLSFVELDFSHPDFAHFAKACYAVKSSDTRLLASHVRSWADVDQCAALGVGAFVGNLYLTPRVHSQSKGLNPAQTMILQLMQLVRENADVRQLENILKRDPAISYKLLRYINSVGFGLGAEIQSLRHAVTMLGYSPLYRWLSLLLATASTAGFSPALMQAAIVRGRFAELLGQGFLPKNEAENLFVVGMFSLLDRLLGVPMAEVLENIQLSDAVSEALLTRQGMYGPFLALAEACERHNGHVGDLAAAMFIDAPKVNEAHLSALSWAQSLKL